MLAIVRPRQAPCPRGWLAFARRAWSESGVERSARHAGVVCVMGRYGRSWMSVRQFHMYNSAPRLHM